MYQTTNEIMVKIKEIGSMYIFYQKQILAILRTGTMLLNRSFFVTMMNIMNKNAAKSRIPSPKASQE